MSDVLWLCSGCVVVFALWKLCVIVCDGCVVYCFWSFFRVIFSQSVVITHWTHCQQFYSERTSIVLCSLTNCLSRIGLDVGKITRIENNHKEVTTAKKSTQGMCCDVILCICCVVFVVCVATHCELLNFSCVNAL